MARQKSKAVDKSAPASCVIPLDSGAQRGVRTPLDTPKPWRSDPAALSNGLVLVLVLVLVLALERRRTPSACRPNGD